MEGMGRVPDGKQHEAGLGISSAWRGSEQLLGGSGVDTELWGKNETSRVIFQEKKNVKRK